jgi:hypothetical protein
MGSFPDLNTHETKATHGPEHFRVVLNHQSLGKMLWLFVFVIIFMPGDKMML